jgi:tetratricopeptide (TPR) repeat protein
VALSSSDLAKRTTGFDPEGLAERLAVEMIARWRSGERPLAEEYLTRYPQLREQPEAAIELIYEELCLRQEYNQPATASDLVRRFPLWQAEIEVLLACHRLLLPDRTTPRWPTVGHRLGDFFLLAELGHGAHGHVFLATQESLAGRPMVLKLIPLDGREHLSLARMQHTHIVPLYAVQDDAARNLRALCMPYFGGATLAQVLHELAGTPPAQRSGRDLREVVSRLQGRLPVQVPPGAAGPFLDRASYAEAICWIGAALADGLQYAHERGLVHLDLKPSNVLLAADGQPMLLDFHLARGPVPPGAPAPEWLGGTIAYMAPEQRQALAAVRAGHPVAAGVDGRADVYALGVVLYEALAGRLPEERPASLRRLNERVSMGLADVIARCLAPDPPRRYARAADLAADLRRHLGHLPLAGVKNRSLGERWQKWRRRRPYALTILGLLIAVLGVSLAGLVHVWGQLSQAREALAEGRQYYHDERYGAAEAALERGLALAKAIPFGRSLLAELPLELRRAARAQAAGDLHDLAERLRFRYDAEAIPSADWQALEMQAGALWRKRDLILSQVGSGLRPDLEQQVHSDLLDLAILWSGLHVRLAGDDLTRPYRKDALGVLQEAERLFGPTRVLCLEMQEHAQALGRPDEARRAAQRAQDLAPVSAWDHQALGCHLLRQGNVAAAAQELEEAVRLRPQSFWANYYRGRCACRQGRYEDAVVSFTACVTLAPATAWCFFNRAVAYTALGRPALALRDYDQALELAPGLAEAALNRGMLHYQEKRYGPALADLGQALAHGADPAAVNYDRALVQLAQGDRQAARASVAEALRHNPKQADARALAERLRAGS